jgi:hypothetical protein
MTRTGQQVASWLGATACLALLSGAGCMAEDEEAVAESSVLAGEVEEIERASTTNLVGNPGLETGSMSPWGIWTSAAVVNTNARSGTYAVRVPSGAGVYQNVSVQPNTTYTLTGYAKTTNSEPVWIGVKNYGGTEKYTEIKNSAYTKGSSTFTTGASNTTAQVYLWKSSGGANYAWGDDFSVTPSTTPLVANWKLDGNAQDSSANGLHASAVGGPGYVTGKIGQAGNMNGSGQYFNVSNNAKINFGMGSFTATAFIRPSAWKWGGIIGRGNPYNGASALPKGWMVTLVADGRIRVVAGDGSGSANVGCYSSGTVPTGVWSHTTMVVDRSAGKLRLYVNGHAACHTTLPAGAMDKNDLRIGRYADSSGNDFAGAIDDVQLHSRALSPSEISQLAQAPVKVTKDGNRFRVDGQLFDLWGMRVASASQTQTLTNQLIANLDSYKNNGLNTITVFYQGSSGGYTDPFAANGLSIDAGHKARMEQIVQAARARGMVVIVGIFYQRNYFVLQDAAAVKNAVRTVVNYLKPYPNVIINVANEQNDSYWSRSAGIYDMRIVQNVVDLCAIVKQEDSTRLVGTGGYNYTNNVTIGKSASVDVLMVDENKVVDWGALYDKYVASGVTGKPIVNVEILGSYTKNWPTPGVFPNEAKQLYYDVVNSKLPRPGFSVFFFSEPWHQMSPIHYELGGQGTDASPGIKWFWDYVKARQ